MDRRTFMSSLAVSALASGVQARQARAAAPSLVPAQPSTAPNYWCTWAAQNYMYGHDLAALDPRILEGGSGANLAHDAMRESILFGERGWAETFYPQIRRDLYFLLDDGWQAGGSSTFVLDAAKFPRFQGSPRDRLAALNRALVDAGWRGAALWCRNTPAGNSGLPLLERSQSASIGYWKIDGGDGQFDLMRLRDETRAALTLEHVHGEIPVNGDWTRDGRFEPQSWDSRRVEILRHSDVYRTYDVTSILSLPTTLDRVAQLLHAAQNHAGVRGLLNVEDEVYLAAVLGCTMGVMRHPLAGLRPGSDVDLFFNGPRQVKRRMDEVVRAVRWQRIAPPFAAGLGSFAMSREILTDSWVLEAGETWQSDLIGRTIRQGAPACLARNIAMPQVSAPGEEPFVYAAAFPSGAAAIGAQQRTQPGNAWFMPACEVTLDVAALPGPFGIFGEFSRLTLVFDRPLQGRRILAQDLAGDEPLDISSQVRVEGARLHLPGEILRSVGLHSRAAGDLSSPALVLALA
ncbi:MAG TPA: hypothetical protein VMD55_04135 [Terracidiphilus sp.]|nr:hypothetical protein [Terracidiphilus sp.]